MAKNNNVNFGLSVSLNLTEANAVAERATGANVSDKLSSIAGWLLQELSKGGVMIPHDWAARIDSAIGTTEPVSIVEHVEKSVGRIGDAVTVQWVVDPTQISFYQTLAENAGISLEHQLKSLLDYAYMQGWFGMGAPDIHKLLLTPEQYRWLQESFSRDIVTGDDVVERLRNAVGEVVTAEGDDLILESLRG